MTCKFEFPEYRQLLTVTCDVCGKSVTVESTDPHATWGEPLVKAGMLHFLVSNYGDGFFGPSGHICAACADTVSVANVHAVLRMIEAKEGAGDQ